MGQPHLPPHPLPSKWNAAPTFKAQGQSRLLLPLALPGTPASPDYPILLSDRVLWVPIYAPHKTPLLAPQAGPQQDLISPRAWNKHVTERGTLPTTEYPEVRDPGTPPWAGGRPEARS